MRLGFRQIKGFSQDDAQRLVEARGDGYPDIPALRHRSGLGRLALERLAAADTLRSMQLDRRQGLWALKALGEAPLPLFAAAILPQGRPASFETTAARSPQNEGVLIDGIKILPHPEELAKPASRRTQGW